MPGGQAKFVSCSRGKLWDVVVDLREDSSTYGQWDAEILTAENGKAVFLSEGLGHAFLSLEDGSIANYLCTNEYEPLYERTINPLSPKLEIAFKSYLDGEFVLSEKDFNAPMFC